MSEEETDPSRAVGDRPSVLRLIRPAPPETLERALSAVDIVHAPPVGALPHPRATAVLNESRASTWGPDPADAMNWLTANPEPSRARIATPAVAARARVPPPCTCARNHGALCR